MTITASKTIILSYQVTSMNFGRYVSISSVDDLDPHYRFIQEEGVWKNGYKLAMACLQGRSANHVSNRFNTRCWIHMTSHQ